VNGHDFEHEADSDTDTRLFETSDMDSDTDMGRVLTSLRELMKWHKVHVNIVA